MQLFCYRPEIIEDAFFAVIKVLETRQRLEALVIPKRQALTQYQVL
jgi:hypothetical protein